MSFTAAGLRRLGLAAGGVASLEAAAYYLFTWWRVFQDGLRGPDFFSFYAAARLFLSRGGAHVYELAAQQEFQGQIAARWGAASYVVLPYIHPPYYTVFIAPLGWLDFTSAYVVWAAVNLALATVALAVLLDAEDLSGRGRLLAIAVAAGFLPLFVTLVQGQSDLVVLAPLALSYRAWISGQEGRAGVLAGLAMVKPQLLFLLPVLFLIRGSWRALAGFGAVAAALAGVSLAAFGPAGIGAYLGVVAPWLLGGAGNWPISGQTVYSLRGLLDGLIGIRPTALAILAFLAIGVALAIAFRRPHRRLDFALVIAASLALSPYQNLHDLVLLLVPGFALARARPPSPYVLAACLLALDLTLFVGSGLALAAVLALAAYLLVERIRLRSDVEEDSLAPGQIDDDRDVQKQGADSERGHAVEHL